MQDSKLDAFDRSDNRLSSYADLGDGQTLNVTQVPIDFAGAGGVVSTTSDMIRFMEALLVSKNTSIARNAGRNDGLRNPAYRDLTVRHELLPWRTLCVTALADLVR